jgi:acyl-CoA thioester hydrolase
VTAPHGSRGRSWSQRVEHVDTDASGVVHFSRYASMLESALLETLEASGAGPAELAACGVELVVTELRIAYRASARFRDVLVGRVGLDHVGGTHIRTRGSLLRQDPGGGETTLADGNIFLGAVASSTGRPVALPAAVRDVWRGLVTDE